MHVLFPDISFLPPVFFSLFTFSFCLCLKLSLRKVILIIQTFWQICLKELTSKKKNSINFVPRKRAACKSVNGSHKYKGNSKDVKPPDLWIHHERLELKPIDKSPDPNPVMTDTPIPRNSQDITPVDNSMDSNIHQRRNSYRGADFLQMLKSFSILSGCLKIGDSYTRLGWKKCVLWDLVNFWWGIASLLRGRGSVPRRDTF